LESALVFGFHEHDRPVGQVPNQNKYPHIRFGVPEHPTFTNNKMGTVILVESFKMNLVR